MDYSFTELRENADFLEKVEMGYHPQSWWQSLDLWPDSRMFLTIAQQGLLIGTAEDGFLFDYAYEDGRIAYVHEAMAKLQSARSTRAYADTNEKIKLECLLYDVWKEKNTEFEKISEDMKEFQEMYSKNKLKMSSAKHDLFI